MNSASIGEVWLYEGHLILRFNDCTTMPKGAGKSPYRCTFCRERLVPLPLEGADRLRLVFLVRPFQCPHCFTCVDRPFTWLARIPVVGWVAKRSLFARASKQKPGVMSTRDGDLSGPATKSLALFGRWVNSCERRIGNFFRGIWKVIWFVPGLFLGKRKRRSSRKRNRFLK